MNLGERILEMRTRANMSQSDLADVLDVSRQSVSKWETNSSVPELGKLLKMSEIFEISMDDLVRGERETLVSASEDTVRSNQSPGKEAQKFIGFGLMGVGSVIFVLVLFLGDFLSALVFAVPFLTTGVVTIIAKKHTALWNGWTLYFMAYVFLRLSTGLRIRWIFQKWVYEYGLTARSTMALLMAVMFGVLLFSTYRAVKKTRASKK
ncbi:MAG TPA: helix-turn-helix transcriptional regulator [Bacteroidales bacterium]|nr:helix-turn-helix transcriptional regulator [Bacteroidales bacterium]